MAPEAARFAKHPHHTVFALSLPVVVSLVAEPITGLVDTAFVARLGAVPLAALGVGTVVLTSAFWVFNFLGIGTQTEVAQALGADELRRARIACGTAVTLGAGLGVSFGLLLWPLLPWVVSAMGARDGVADAALVYLEIRLLGAPPMLVMMAALGALRGLHDMRTPLRIAVGINVLNVVLDPVLIFGLGPVPALGVAGAAWATVVAQWVGGGLAFAAARRQLGRPERFALHEARALLVVGRDLFLRTGLLVAFILLTTRAATRIGTDAGAAHQAIRQVWLTTALLLDAFAAVGQSLVGTCIGAARVDLARRAADVATRWSLVAGVAITVLMLGSESWVARMLVPESAHGVFTLAWRFAAVLQPVNALSFVTDGIHWGTRDYRYLRNAMAASTGVGTLALVAGEWTGRETLASVWAITGAWISVRAVFGVVRVWPGWGNTPLRDGNGSGLS